jgi:ubiquinone/menaquinone biosynthesis C-methylase UbiE
MDQTKIAVNLFNKLSDAYQEKFMNVSMYHKSLDLLCENIQKENACLLEVACGPGNITNYLIEKRPDLKILATDLAPNMIALAKINNPTADFELLDFREMDSVANSFDAIVCGFGLPYLTKSEAIDFIGNAASKLQPEGLLYISTMEDDNNKSGFKTGSTGDTMFQNFHQADYLTNTLEENNFILLHLERIDYFYNDQKTTDLILIAKKLTQ